MITYRFEFKDGTTTRTRTIKARTLGGAFAEVKKNYPTWQILGVWELKDLTA